MEWKVIGGGMQKPKKCRKCDTELIPGENITEYSYNNSIRKCKTCMQADRVLYSTATKDRAINYLGGKCADCGGVFHRRVYDFHHVNPEEKEHTVAHMLRCQKWETVKQELDKCVLLCANCHRIRHADEDEL